MRNEDVGTDSPPEFSSASDRLPSPQSLGLSSIIHLDSVTSTMDEAHARAECGEPAGLLVVADYQSAGRGRVGKKWDAGRGAGLWLTLVERPKSSESLNLLSLRVGLSIARVLETLTYARVLVKWPNDVFLDRGRESAPGKVAGVLIEARWREQLPDWVAIGVGINLRLPSEVTEGAALGENVSRSELLQRLIPFLREAAATEGELSGLELADWHSRDLALGRRITAPVAGTVCGIDQSGALQVRESRPGVGVDGPERPLTLVRSGSMEFAATS